MLAIGDQRRAPGILGHIGGLLLGQHAAAAEAARALGDGDILTYIVDFLDQFRAGLFRVLVVEAVDAGEDHEMIRLDHLGDFRSKTVIVAHADFLGRDRIVLVHDWQDVALQQAVDSVLGVQEALALLHILEGHEDLGDVKSELVRNLLVGIQQQRHATCGGGLLVAQSGGFRLFVEHVQAKRDSARRTQHDFISITPQFGDVFKQPLYECPARCEKVWIGKQA